ncbi:MAG: hypothetical protein KDA21_03000 [Phycisphaerales bacterium]|nr:hypothetical protein [Phycisphaerales bacterium]
MKTGRRLKLGRLGLTCLMWLSVGLLITIVASLIVRDFGTFSWRAEVWRPGDDPRGQWPTGAPGSWEPAEEGYVGEGRHWSVVRISRVEYSEPGGHLHMRVIHGLTHTTGWPWRSFRWIRVYEPETNHQPLRVLSRSVQPIPEGIAKGTITFAAAGWLLTLIIRLGLRLLGPPAFFAGSWGRVGWCGLAGIVLTISVAWIDSHPADPRQQIPPSNTIVRRGAILVPGSTGWARRTVTAYRGPDDPFITRLHSGSWKDYMPNVPTVEDWVMQGGNAIFSGAVSDEQFIVIDIRSGLPFASMRRYAAATDREFGPVEPLPGARGGYVLPDVAWLPDRGLPLIPLWSGFALDALIFGALLWGGWGLLSGTRRARRRRRGRCAWCGYDLGDLATCPECGRERPTTQAGPDRGYMPTPS